MTPIILYLLIWLGGVCNGVLAALVVAKWMVWRATK